MADSGFKEKEDAKKDQLSEQVVEEVFVDERTCYDRYATLYVLIGAAIGITTGIGLANWEPENPETKSIIIKWIGLVGDMFVRMLKLVVLPLVFVNIILAMNDMLSVGGRARKLGLTTFVLYFLTTLIGAIIGVFIALIFRDNFSTGEDVGEDADLDFMIGCGGESDGEGYVSIDPVTGILTCANTSITSLFTLTDVGGQFATTSSSGPANDVSLSDTLYSGIFEKIIADNLIGAFNTNAFAAVVAFALVFGAALFFSANDSGRESTLTLVLADVDKVFLKIINWIIRLTPFAVASLIANALGNQDDLDAVFRSVGYLVGAVITAMLLHVVLVHYIIHFLVVRKNPFAYMKYIIPAQTMAFACASSAATLPVTMQCVKNTGEIPISVRRFVLSIGATMNMDGTALYFPSAITFMAANEGITLGFADYILVVIISTIGSAGAAPIPSGALVLVLTAFQTVSGFAEGVTPASFAFVIAIDWFLDRLQTVINISGDSVVSRMVTKITGVPMEDETEPDSVEASQVAI